MSSQSTDDIPFCWLALLEDIESTTILLSYGTHPGMDDPAIFLRPVPLMLTSIWEAFHIRCVAEATAFLAGFAPSPNALPKELRKHIADEIRQEKSDLAPWSIAGENWRDLMRKRVMPDELRLGSGKSRHIDEYYAVGIGLVKLSSKWTGTRKAGVRAGARIDYFIEIRDKITHRGEGLLSAEDCWQFRQLVVKQAIRTTAVVDQHIQSHTGNKFCSLSMTQLLSQLNPYKN